MKDQKMATHDDSHDALATFSDLQGMIPSALEPRSYHISLADFELMVDIGFHDFEVGSPQRVQVNVDIWLDPHLTPTCDQVDKAWNYDCLRQQVTSLAQGRRFNLLEALVGEIYAVLAARAGVKALRVSAAKPDVFPDCRHVAVELASFDGCAPR